MDWSYDHALLYSYIEYETIESFWTEQVDLPQLWRNLFQQQQVWL